MATKTNKLLSVFAIVGKFLFASLKRSVGAKTNAEFIETAFNIAGGFIVQVEGQTKPDGTALAWHEKLERAAKLLIDFYAAQGVRMAFSDAIDIVTSKFTQVNTQRIETGFGALTKQEVLNYTQKMVPPSQAKD